MSSTNNTETFSNDNLPALNQIVRGRVAGVFVVLGRRMIADELHLELKRIDPKTQEMAPGTLHLEPHNLRAFC